MILKKFKEYINSYYDINDNEKEKAIKELNNRTRIMISSTINKILDNPIMNIEELSKLLLGTLFSLNNCTEKQIKHLENSIKDESLF